ncbi:hypothetical protein HK405_009308 [Cladochytrium tenue]|nr:hypothetical protein HK405_009308 [Cladochytrium tenue]
MRPPPKGVPVSVGAATAPRASPSDDSARASGMAVNIGAAATWSAASQQSSRSDLTGHDRLFGAANAFEDSLYVLPADADERARLHMQHVVIRSLFGGNFHTPQRELFANEEACAKILDVGCGTGSWCIDMAKQFPHAPVTGVDLVSYEHAELPRNVTFELGNVLEGLRFSDRTFDFVYQRLLVLALPKESVTSVIKELIRVTKPGGYIQLHEKGTEEDEERVASGPASVLFNSAIAALEARGVDPTLGLEDVRGLVRIVPVRINIHLPKVTDVEKFGWNGPIGQLFLADMRKFFNGMKPFLLKALDVTEETFSQLIEDALQQCKSELIYAKYYVAFGQVAR